MTTDSYPGKFVVFEGLDGAGKTTQIKMLTDYFNGDKFGFCLKNVIEPTQLLIGGLIRSRLLGDWQSSPDALQLLFAADRADHLQKEIFPALRGNALVVCDRYSFSTIAYGAIDCDFDWLVGINSSFLVPDLTIFLDVPVKECAIRMGRERGSIELFEKISTLEKVGRNYRTVIEKFQNNANIKIINGNRKKEEIFEDVFANIKKLLLNSK